MSARIVKFAGRNGDTFGVNPDHVAYCAPPMQNGSPVLGFTAIQLAQPTVKPDGTLVTTIVLVKGDVSETIERLNHGTPEN